MLLTKITAMQNKVMLTYHRVCNCRLYFLAVIFVVTLVNFEIYITGDMGFPYSLDSVHVTSTGVGGELLLL